MKLVLELLTATLLCLFVAITYSMVADSGPGRPAPQQPEPRAPKAIAPGDQPDASQSWDSAPANSDRVHHLLHQGRERRYLVHVPSGYDDSKSWPIVLAFHGNLGRAESLAVQSQLDRVADRHGFLVIYPDGTGRSTQMLSFNAGTCCGFAARAEVDDVGFVRSLLDELPSRYAADPRRTYATGIGNGAMLCYRLACEMPERIAAIGPVAGGMAVDGPAPTRPVAVIHFHGLQDRFAPYGGGIGPTPMQEFYHRPIAEVIAWWARMNHCAAEPAGVERRKEYVLARFAPSAGKPGAPVLLYTLPEGGHNWPGGVDVTAHKGTGSFVGSVDASSLMWGFFEQFTLDDRGDGPAGRIRADSRR